MVIKRYILVAESSTFIPKTFRTSKFFLKIHSSSFSSFTSVKCLPEPHDSSPRLDSPPRPRRSHNHHHHPAKPPSFVLSPLVSPPNPNTRPPDAARPSFPPNIENLSHLPTPLSPTVIHALADLHGPLVSWFKSHPSPPRFILSDMFLGWTHHLASQLGIKNIIFSSSAAMAISIMLFVWEDLPFDRTSEFVSFDWVPIVLVKA